MLSEHVSGVLEHKKKVANNLRIVIHGLMQRAIVHDDSKFSSEELETFEKITPRLKTLTYGTEEYKAALNELGPALQHHYQVNSHHPEFHAGGVNGMDLLDAIEMLCDWMAAVQRVKDGNIYQSLQINKERFGIDDQLFSILKNTVDALTR